LCYPKLETKQKQILKSAVARVLRHFDVVINDEEETYGQDGDNLPSVYVNRARKKKRGSVESLYVRPDGINGRVLVEFSVAGKVNEITQERKSNTSAEEAMNLVQPFPTQTSFGEFGYLPSSTTIALNGQPLSAVNLWHRRSETHEPFGQERNFCFGQERDFCSDDGYIRTPEFDVGNRLAFILNRYAWGMNVSVALLDPQSRTVYMWRSDNFDMPTGIAIRRRPDGAVGEYEIFVARSTEDHCVYRAPTKKPVSERRPDSYWCPLTARDDFTKLEAYFVWSEIHPERLQSNVSEVEAHFWVEYKAAKYSAAAEIAREYLKAPLNEFKTKEMQCNLALCLVHLDQPDAAMELLNSVGTPWLSRQRFLILGNRTFDVLRPRQDFARLIHNIQQVKSLAKKSTSTT
jgi:hypothetical protein